MEERLLELEKRLDKAVSTIEKHNYLLEGILSERTNHQEEHDFLREMIQKERLRNQIKQKVLINLLTGGATVMAVATFSALWIYFKEIVLGR